MYRAYLKQLEAELDALDKGLFNEPLLEEDQQTSGHEAQIPSEDRGHDEDGTSLTISDVGLLQSENGSTTNNILGNTQRGFSNDSQTNDPGSSTRKSKEAGMNGQRKLEKVQQPKPLEQHKTGTNPAGVQSNGQGTLTDDQNISRDPEVTGYTHKDKSDPDIDESIDRVERNIKVVLLGEAGSGKTSILRHVTGDDFRTMYHFTVGLDFLLRRATRPGVEMQVWDTPGKESCRPPRELMKMAFKDVDAFLIVYDVTNMASFEKVSTWFDLSRTLWTGSRRTMIVGNKTDAAEKAVSTSTGKELADKCSAGFWEMSAKLGENVTECFDYLESVILE